MRWESWPQFWDMGGYGLYVWGRMGMPWLILVLEIWQARVAHQNALALAATERQDLP